MVWHKPVPTMSPKSKASAGKNTKPLQVGVYLDLNTGAWREVLLGVADYANTHGPWLLQHGLLKNLAKPELGRPDVQGCVAAITDPWSLDLVESWGFPTVNVAGNLMVEGFPSVLPDNRKVGELAARHFHEKGFRSLAYLSSAGRVSSDLRQEGFMAAARDLGLEPPRIPQPVREGNTNKRVGSERGIDKWLLGLPKPCGLLAFNDSSATNALQRCHQLGIAVPTQLAVLGVDNDPMICETAFPPLSSVNPNFRKIGQIAAELLRQMLAGKGGNIPSVTRVDPLGVIGRHSTDILAVEDEMVARALRYIRQHASENIGVADLLVEVPLSRRMLERRFRDCVGHTLHDEIIRVRVERAKTLLVGGHANVDQVGEACGFNYPAHFTSVFRTQTGMTPSAFRKKNSASRRV